MRLPDGYEIYGLLRMIGRFAERRQDGRGLHSVEIQQLEPMLTDELVQQMLAELCEIDLLKRAETGEWLLARDLDSLTMSDLYEACRLRIPVAEAHLPCRDDALGVAAVTELDQLRLPLRDLLKRRVSSSPVPSCCSPAAIAMRPSRRRRRNPPRRRRLPVLRRQLHPPRLQRPPRPQARSCRRSRSRRWTVRNTT
jgi:hypothetical protein